LPREMAAKRTSLQFKNMAFRNVRKLVIVLAALGVLAIVAMISLMLGRTAPHAPPPSPNGYDDYRMAGEATVGDIGDFSSLNHDGLRGLVCSNAEPLRLLRLGLSHQCAVPTDLAVTNFSALCADLPHLKNLALLLAAEGRLSEMENRPGDAAHSYAEAVCFGNEMSRGGVLINRMVGAACQGIGINSLVKVTPELNPQQAQATVRELEKADADSVSLKEILENENRFARSQLGHYSNPLTLVKELWQTRLMTKDAERTHHKAVARVRLLQAELALRCYRSEQTRVPARLEDLVPSYLQRVPLDPFSGRPLLYRPQGTNWLLYSVGPDRVDDGGKSVGRSGFYMPGFGSPPKAPKGDLLFDSPW
jgi:hypothetical protein